MLQLNVESRNIFGKKLAKSKSEGKIPAVLYGNKKEVRPLFVNLKEFKKIWKKAEESTVIKLKNDSDAKFSENVLVYDLAKNPLNGEPIHVDFYAIDMSKSITANVPIIFEGVSPAVKEKGAVLVKVVHELEIEALPDEFPHDIKIDVSVLAGIGDKIFVKDLNLGKSVKVNAKGDQIIILAKPHEEEKVEEKTISVSDIEISEKKGKKEEEGAAAEAGKAGGEAKKTENKK